MAKKLTFSQLIEGEKYRGTKKGTRESLFYVKLWGALFVKLPWGAALRRARFGVGEIDQMKFEEVA